MKKGFIATFFVAFSIMICGCGAGNKPFEPKHKTEVTVETVESGVVPQEIERTTSYIQEEKGGEWKAESSEITNWSWGDFNMQDTVWLVESEDATSIYADLDASFKNKPAALYLHFNNNLRDFKTEIIDGDKDTAKLDMSLSITCDIIFESNGVKLYYEKMPVTHGWLFLDGSGIITINNDGTALDLNIPSDARLGSWSDFFHAIPTEEEAMDAVSETLIAKTIFQDMTSFSVTSSNVTNGVWDTKITNTEKGENLSPELAWDSVEGATLYAVFMIDGAWLHMDVYTSETSLEEGSIDDRERFRQYIGPYPPSGTHTYSVFVFALANEPGKVPFMFNAGGNSIDQIYQKLDADVDGNTGNVLAYGRLDGNYTYGD